MPVAAVANPKGGGQVHAVHQHRGLLCQPGHPVILATPTGSSPPGCGWARPPAARPIGSRDTTPDVISRPPISTHARGADTPAGLCTAGAQRRA